MKAHAQLGPKKLKSWPWKTLGEDVSKLKMRWDKLGSKFPLSYKFSNKMIIQVNMFSSFMSHGILAKKDSNLIVTEELRPRRWRGLKLMKKI